jgi:STE24 endopeptidase
MDTSLLAALFIAVFVIDALADFLNLRTARQPLPASLQTVQTPEQQKRAAEYLADRVRLGLLRGAWMLGVTLALLYGGFFGWLEQAVAGWTDSPLLQSLFYAAVIMSGRALLQLPFAAFSTFRVEEKYGFNRTTVSTFIGDRVKGLLIGGVLGGLLFAFVIHAYSHWGENAFLKIWAGYTAFQFFLVWLAPVTLLPLFLKLQPLPEGDLKNEIERYRTKLDFKLDGAWVCDASKRSAKSNAFFTGFGRFRRLVLFDTLIANHPKEEITAIVAHEAGHFKLGHIWKMSVTSTLTSLLLFYVIQKLIATPSLYEAFRAQPGQVGIGLVLAMMLIDQVQFFFSPLSSYFSRRNEYAADRFSVETTGDAGSMARALKRLVSDNLSTLQHHPLYVILHDSHPPLPDRVAALERPRA